MSAQVPAISTKIQIQPLLSFCVVSNTDTLQYSQGMALLCLQVKSFDFLKGLCGQMFWSLKNTEITSFSKRLKFYFIVLLQVFSR